jgi:hypothetical protein
MQAWLRNLKIQYGRIAAQPEFAGERLSAKYNDIMSLQRLFERNRK